ncbi:MAG: UDP-2,3-diacylglucosamine diphosphatase [Saprospiraceae bacterium]|nr:UDP-2,3-diacylglucosamine diphosphatase [Saprospiraceae bacterium]
MNNTPKIYFVSDAHLGIPTYEKSLVREKLLVKWLDEIKSDAEEIYLLGDIFDFWHEYKRAIPKGFVRIFGKLAELTDSGIKIHFFTGNHDIWCYDYFQKELNLTVHKKPISKEILGKKFFLGHGDGLGPKDFGYKFIKRVFAGKLNQWLFARLHPNFGIGLGLLFSKRSNHKQGDDHLVFLGEDNEWQYVFAKEKLQKEHFDYFVFGHRHISIIKEITDKSKFVILGDWITKFSYGVFDGEKFELKRFGK